MTDFRKGLIGGGSLAIGALLAALHLCAHAHIGTGPCPAELIGGVGIGAMAWIGLAYRALTARLRPSRSEDDAR